ncbi:hypothetical protein [Streptomyces sp. NPDC056255]|uniref:hypothetical protein n=1 Tax=Streptomyces sp. NPDC056255 TaxID=3345764 RepID=UPI0035D722EA
MNVLIVHAHPDPASFNTALKDRVGTPTLELLNRTARVRHTSSRPDSHRGLAR